MVIATDNRAPVFSWLRSISNGKLTSEQVTAGDLIIDKMGLDVFATSIGFKLTLGVSGQWDISDKGYAIIRQFEGLRTKAYLDSVGKWTIGYGTIKYPNGASVKQGDTCSAAQAEQWLKHDCGWVDAAVDKYVKVKIKQGHHDALASFVYNVGETAFSNSDLLEYLNAGKPDLALKEFPKWNKGTISGRKMIIPGLANRRAQEAALFKAA